jgi:hypothetical protein
VWIPALCSTASSCSTSSRMILPKRTCPVYIQEIGAKWNTSLETMGFPVRNAPMLAVFVSPYPFLSQLD